MTSRANVMLTAALTYAERGLAVFPCGSDKRPFTPNGHRDATTDPDAIRGWWLRWPNANIGHRPSANGVVIDLDAVKKKSFDSTYEGYDDWTWDGPDGPSSFDTFLSLLNDEERESCLSTPIAQTGRMGLHFYFADPDGVFSCTSGRLAEHIDTRTSDGYVLLPPSETVFRCRDQAEAVGRYQWVSRPLGDIQPRAVPDSLVALFKGTRSLSARARAGLAGREGARTPRTTRSRRAAPGLPPGLPPDRRRRYGLAALEGAYEAVRTAAEGTRNDTLNRAAFAAGTLVGARVLDAAHAATELYEAAAASGLTHAEAVATIRSGLAAGVARPREVR